MSLWLILALQASQAAPAVGTFDLAKTGKPRDALARAIVPRCDDRASSDEVVVCARRRDLYRLALPHERAPATDRALDEGSSGVAAMTPPAPCGIFAGERRCSKREVARYGYGGGRDPVTVLTRLATRLADPDSD